MAMLLVQQDKKRWEKLDITVFSEANWGKWHWLCNLSSSQVEFKLKLEKQAVASTTKIRASLWGDSGTGDNGGSATKKFRIDDPTNV